MVLGADESPYTVDTLRRLSGAGELFLIVGADQFATLDRWHDPTGIRRLATLVAAPRPGVEIPDGDVVELEMAPVDLSSSGVRSALARPGRTSPHRFPRACFRWLSRDIFTAEL